jgi:hypothetical protein
MLPGTNMNGNDAGLEDRVLQASDCASTLQVDLTQLHTDMKTAAKEARVRDMALQESRDQLARRLTNEEFEKIKAQDALEKLSREQKLKDAESKSPLKR